MFTMDSRRIYFLACKILLLCSILYYVRLCPYTKVEESFNMQASHDLLMLSKPFNAAGLSDLRGFFSIDNFDHLEFPGVVPRTFMGAIFLSICSSPFHAIFRLFDLPLFYSQNLVRSILGITSWCAYTVFSDSVSIRFGWRAGCLTCMLAAVQFHLPFYMSRTLPNSFALIFCLIAFSYWLNKKGIRALLVVAVAMIIFRCDLLLLIAPLTLQLLVSREVPFWLTACLGLGTSALALLLSAAVDSYFWQRYQAHCATCCMQYIF